jgi:hypothetical protein
MKNIYNGFNDRLLKTKEIVGYDPITGRKIVRFEIDDSEFYESKFEKISEPYYQYGTTGSAGISGLPGSSGEYGTSGSFIDNRSIINWELHQKTLPKTKIETEIRKEFLPKNKISNTPVKIDKKNKPDKKKNEPKKIQKTALSLIKSFASLAFPVNLLQQIIKKQKW